MIYNVVLNSTNNAGGDDSSNYSYNFDWSNVEDGAYELTFTFNAVGSTVDSIIVVSCPDLGVSSNVFTTKSTLTAQSFNNVLGVIYPTSTLDYIVSTQHNPPIYLQTRPHSSLMTIYLYDIAGALIDINANYVLILSLKKI